MNTAVVVISLIHNFCHRTNCILCTGALCANAEICSQNFPFKIWIANWNYYTLWSAWGLNYFAHFNSSKEESKKLLFRKKSLLLDVLNDVHHLWMYVQPRLNLFTQLWIVTIAQGQICHKLHPTQLWSLSVLSPVDGSV